MDAARRLAIVGKDLGDAERCRRLAAARGRRPGLVARTTSGSSDFAAAHRRGRRRRLPLSRASQSGVLALAAQLGVPSIASDVGGLRELATAVVPRDVDAAGLADAVDELLAAPPPRNGHDPVEATVQAHRDAYGLA